MGVDSAYGFSMQMLPISEVEDRLNDLVDAASRTPEQVTITKNGTPAAVLIGIDEWESLQETLFWLSQPGIRASIGEAIASRHASSTHLSSLYSETWRPSHAESAHHSSGNSRGCSVLVAAPTGSCTPLTTGQPCRDSCASIIDQMSTEATDRDSRNTSAWFKTDSALTAVLDELRPAI